MASMTIAALASEAVQQVREHLAACLPMLAGWDREDICNHCSALVCGASAPFLASPYGCGSAKAAAPCPGAAWTAPWQRDRASRD